MFKNFSNCLKNLIFSSQNTCEEKLIKFDLFRSLFFHAIPTIFTICVTYYTIKNNIFNPVLIPIIRIVCILVVIINIYNCWNEIIKKDFIETLYNSRQIENKYIKLKTDINNISNEIYSNTTFALILLKISNTIIDFINSNERNNNQALYALMQNRIINCLYDYLTPTLNKGEHITIAVYLFDETNNILVDFVSKKSNIMPKGKRGRNWSINSESQISHTYRSKKYHVFYDIQKFLPGLSENEKRPFDEEFYRASITYPLRFYDENNNIRGVFCITSNMPGAFSLNIAGETETPNDNLNKLFTTKQNLIFSICTLIELLLNQTFPDSNNRLLRLIHPEITELN